VSRASCLPILSLLCPSILGLGVGTGQTTDNGNRCIMPPYALWREGHKNQILEHVTTEMSGGAGLPYIFHMGQIKIMQNFTAQISEK